MLVLTEMLHVKLKGKSRATKWSGIDWRWKWATDFFMRNQIRMMESNYADVVIMQIDSMSRQRFTFVLISRQMNTARQSRLAGLKLQKKGEKKEYRLNKEQLWVAFEVCCVCTCTCKSQDWQTREDNRG